MKTIRTLLASAAILVSLLSTSASVARADANCVVEGTVDLRVQGTDQFGSVSGWIGTQSFYGRISAGRLNGDVGPFMVSLFVDRVSREDLMISGWIGNTYVSWRSFGNWINAGYACLN